MRKLEDKPVVAELKANPIFFYGAGRAAQRFAKQLGGVDISYQSEGDYYGDRLSSIDVGPEYEQAFSNFEAEIESMFALSTAGSDDQIIEQGLLAEYGRLLPKLAGKHYVIKRVAVADIVRRRTNTNDSVVGIYSHDRWRQQTMARSARNANARNRRVGLKGSVEADFAALVKAQPQMLVVTNEHGKHDIIDGYHRFKSLATSQLPPTPKHVFVLAAE
jgi:hypothetical protein